MLNYQTAYADYADANFKNDTLLLLKTESQAKLKTKRNQDLDISTEIKKYITQIRANPAIGTLYTGKMLGYRKLKFEYNQEQYRLIYAILDCCPTAQKQTYNCRFYENCNNFPKEFAPEACAGLIRFYWIKIRTACAELYNQSELFFAHYLKDNLNLT